MAVTIVTLGGPFFAAAGGNNFQWVPLEDPIANIYSMDVLFDDDVSGENPIMDPVAEPTLGRRGI